MLFIAHSLQLLVSLIIAMHLAGTKTIDKQRAPKCHSMNVIETVCDLVYPSSIVLLGAFPGHVLLMWLMVY